MEYKITIGYCDGKDRQGIQRDIPTLIVNAADVRTKEVTMINMIQGEKAKMLFKELVKEHINVGSH